MYRAIASHPTTRQINARRLIDEGSLSEAETEQMVTGFLAHLESQFQAANSYRPNKADWLEGAWTGLEAASGEDRRGETAAPTELLQTVGAALSHVPEGVNINRKIPRPLEAKRQAIWSGQSHH